MVRSLLRSGIKGRTRLTLFLAGRMRSLQSIPVRIEHGGIVYADLRVSSSHRLLMDRDWESDEQSVMRRFIEPGNTVFDIGAHIGIHTILLSHLVGPEGSVFAFEPNTELLPSLEQTISVLPNVTLHKIALSDETAEGLLVVPGDATMASLRDWTDGMHGSTHNVACELHRLDDMSLRGVLQQPDFIKCDVEGAELLVFRGGRKMLDRADAPIVLFEANTNSARGFGLPMSAAMDFLASLNASGYHFFEIERGAKLVPVRSLRSNHTNVLAVPDSRIPSILATEGE